ncbi:calcium-binding protein [Pseudonocardiaceae bacterium YIM PH 21723]|nr:calcium-binding protein [Pseudonocardiaceae bacterium YIM PH 21723]
MGDRGCRGRPRTGSLGWLGDQNWEGLLVFVSEFLGRKLDRRFRMLDSNRNGVIDERDFTLAAAGLASEFGHAPGSPRAQRLLNTHLATWKELLRAADENGDGKVSPEEFKRAFTTTILVSQEAYERAYLPMLLEAIMMADADGDGELTAGEFQRLNTVYMHASAEDSADVFTRLDRDSSGTLTVQEISDAIREYYFSEDPAAPGNWLLGPPPVEAEVAPQRQAQAEESIIPEWHSPR